MSKIDRFKKILLVYPETPAESYWSFSHSLGMIGKKTSTPPLGILTVAAMLSDEEFSLRLVDMNAGEITDSDIEWADVVFVSAMIAQKVSMEAVLKRVKTFAKTVVAGGPYSSSAYNGMENVDCFVIGEAEGVWDAFIADLRQGSLKPAYAAPVRDKEAAELRSYFGPDAHVVQAECHPDVNLAPLPRFDLLDLDKYALMPVQASRGCPVGCEFCDIWRRFGRRTRIKASERILAELSELYRLGWRDSVFLVDDNFIGNRPRAKEVLTAIVGWQKERQWPFTFLTEATLSLADDAEMLDLMADAGFTSVFVGIETPSEDSLRETGKQINLNGSMSEKAARIQAKGIEVMSGFIIGFDADPDDIADRMTACIQELGIPQAMIGILTALPDTDLHDRLEAKNRISNKSVGNNTHTFSMNFIPTRPEADVLRDYKLVLERAYPSDMKAYFQRCEVLRGRWPKKSNSHWNPPLGWKLKVLGKYTAAVLKSPYRFSALGFMLKTLLVKPSFIVHAVELGVKGHHLWAITQQAFEVEAMRTRLSSYLRSISAHARQRVESLDKAFGGVLDKHMPSRDFTMEGMLALLDKMMETSGATAEFTKMQARAEDVIAEISAYGRRIRMQAESEYQRLSNAARATLVDDMERFLLEINQRYMAVSRVRST